MTPRTNDPDDLPWQAFCYVAGELDPAEAEVFEARLDHDQAAREALAGAVELVEVVSQAGQRAPVARRERPVVAVLATAAALTLAVGLGGLRFGAPDDSHEPAPARAALVALAWSGLRQSGEAEPGADPLFAGLDEPSRADDPAAADDPGGEPPAWLVEAAALRASKAPES
jgi:hypothetical protein